MRAEVPGNLGAVRVSAHRTMRDPYRHVEHVEEADPPLSRLEKRLQLRRHLITVAIAVATLAAASMVLGAQRGSSGCAAGLLQ
jgi:hypothetical protein